MPTAIDFEPTSGGTFTRAGVAYELGRADGSVVERAPNVRRTEVVAGAGGITATEEATYWPIGVSGTRLIAITAAGTVWYTETGAAPWTQLDATTFSGADAAHQAKRGWVLHDADGNPVLLIATLASPAGIKVSTNHGDTFTDAEVDGSTGLQSLGATVDWFSIAEGFDLTGNRVALMAEYRTYPAGTETGGVVTLTTGPCVAEGDMVDVYWLAGTKVRAGCTVMDVTGAEVTLDGGIGDALPGGGTAVNILSPQMRLYLSRDGGQTWATVLIANGVAVQRCIHFHQPFIHAATGYLGVTVGDWGVLPTCQAILLSTDGGATWAAMETPGRQGLQSVAALDFGDPDEILLGSDDYSMVVLLNLRTGVKRTALHNAHAQFSRNFCWMLAQHGGLLFAADYNATSAGAGAETVPGLASLYVSPDRGGHWAHLWSDSAADLVGVHGLAHFAGYFAADACLHFLYYDGSNAGVHLKLTVPQVTLKTAAVLSPTFTNLFTANESGGNLTAYYTAGGTAAAATPAAGAHGNVPETGKAMVMAFSAGQKVASAYLKRFTGLTQNAFYGFSCWVKGVGRQALLQWSRVDKNGNIGAIVPETQIAGMMTLPAGLAEYSMCAFVPGSEWQMVRLPPCKFDQTLGGTLAEGDYDTGLCPVLQITRADVDDADTYLRADSFQFGLEPMGLWQLGGTALATEKLTVALPSLAGEFTLAARFVSLLSSEELAALYGAGTPITKVHLFTLADAAGNEIEVYFDTQNHYIRWSYNQTGGNFALCRWPRRGQVGIVIRRTGAGIGATTATRLLPISGGVAQAAASSAATANFNTGAGTDDIVFVTGDKDGATVLPGWLIDAWATNCVLDATDVEALLALAEFRDFRGGFPQYDRVLSI